MLEAPPRWRLSQLVRSARRAGPTTGGPQFIAAATARVAPVGEWWSRGNATLPHDARFAKMRCRILAAYMVE